ncbi:MAG: tetratricopeptide repeat protein [Cyanobacteria bacterium SZAS TMP-1]|nr:tetratricopeptide repeat protein [Cyanobacteria bacterium SZAS TMP-1]
MDGKESKARQPIHLVVGLILAVVALCLAVYFYLCIPTPGDNGARLRDKEVLALRNSAGTFIRDGRFDEGIARLSRALTLTPGNPVVLMDRAAAFYRKKEYASALNDYQGVLSQKGVPEGVAEDALFGVALTQAALDRNEQAIATLHDLQAKNTHFIRAYQLMGDIYLKTKDSEAALDAYTQGLRLNPKSPVLHYDRAVAYLRRDMNEQAFDDLSKAVELDPRSLPLRIKHANLAQKLGRLGIADNDAQEILRLEPDNRTALSWLKSRKIAPQK